VGVGLLLCMLERGGDEVAQALLTLTGQLQVRVVCVCVCAFVCVWVGVVCAQLILATWGLLLLVVVVVVVEGGTR
jgi:hypothetical protein